MHKEEGCSHIMEEALQRVRGKYWDSDGTWLHSTFYHAKQALGVGSLQQQ